MSDMVFRPGFVPARYRDVVSRAAVLYTLYRPLKTAEQIGEYTLRVVRLWRYTLARLRDAGWHEQSAGVQFMRNCCPTFASCTPASRACRVAHLCPFCYARWVQQLWTPVDAGMSDLRSLQPPTVGDDGVLELPALAHTPYTLIERRHGFRVPFLPEPYYQQLARAATGPTYRGRQLRTLQARDPAAYEQHLRYILSAMTKARGEWMQAVPCHGAVYHTTVEPWEDCWYVEHRQLFLLDANQELRPDIEQTTRGAFRRHVQPTRKQVAAALIRTCAYPSLLLRGDYDLTAILLRARQRCRLSATYGTFRQTKSSIKAALPTHETSVI